VFRTTGADGARLDDVKGTWAPFVREFMTHGVMASKFFYSEFFDGNLDILNNWATNQPMAGGSLAMHWALQAAATEPMRAP
jgi:alpha-amylase